MKDKLNKKNIKSIISIIGTFLFIGLCTVGIIKAAASYNYGSAVPSQKLYFANRKEVFSIFEAEFEAILHKKWHW